MSLRDLQKPRASWWQSSAAGRSWFNSVKEKLTDRDSAKSSVRTGSKVGLRQSKG